MAVNLEFTRKIKAIQAEDEKDVAFIKKHLLSENYTLERLGELLLRGRQYEAIGGSRGNRNVIKAVESLLTHNENKISYAQA